MIAWALGMPHFADASYQLSEPCKVIVVENSFLRTHAENNLRCAEKRPRLVCQPCSRELQSMTTKSNLRGRQSRDFGFRHQVTNPRDRRRKSPLCCRFVGRVHKARCHITAVG